MSGGELVPKLAELLKKRRTSELFSCISNDSNNRLIRSYPIQGRFFEDVIVIMAEAVELGYPNFKILQDLLRKIPIGRQNSFAGLVAKGVLATRRGKVGASLFFQRALCVKRWVSAEHIIFVRHCLSNSWRKPGDYAKALHELERARRLAEAAKLPEIVEDLRVDEAWLHFQRSNDAAIPSALFDRAEPILRAAGDHRRLGDIASGRGRIEQRAGRLDRAAEHYRESLSYYDQCPVLHRGRGRTLINLGKVEVLQARQIRLRLHQIKQRINRTTLATYDVAAVSLARIDTFFQRHRGETVSEELKGDLLKSCDLDRRQYSRGVNQNDTLRQLQARLLNQAAHHLDEAKQFYESNPAISDFQGLGREMVIRGYLHIEKRDWSATVSLARLTLNFGRKHASKIVQARAKIVETMAYVQQFWHNPNAAPDQIELVLQTGQQALDLSMGLQDRIKIKALTWSSLAQLCQVPPNLAAAFASVDKIEKMIFGMPNDYVTEDADMLKRMCEQLASQQDQDVIRLAAIILSHDQREVPWEATSRSVLDFRIECLLRRCDYNVDLVRRILKIHPRLVRPIRDRLLKISPPQPNPELQAVTTFKNE
jgi:tetratricopeptide (TPR) repeat protein